MDNMIRNATVFESPPNSPPGLNDGEEVQASDSAKRGRKQVKRDRAKAYKKIKKLEEELQKKAREADKYRKRFERANEKKTKSKSQNNKYKLRLIMKESKLRGKLKQQLLLHCVVADQIKRRMKSKHLLNAEQKRVLSSVVSKKILKKYNLMSVSREMLGITFYRMKFNSLRQNKPRRDQFRRKSYKNAVSKKIKELIRNFLEEDINSRMLPGKKDTITRKKVKKQKRVLTNSMKELHKQFLARNETTVSYATFCRLRPFWIVDPQCDSRDTCTCKLHANTNFKFERLKQNGVLKSQTLKEACESLCCNAVTKQCMYRDCKLCENKTLELNEYEKEKQVWVNCWQNRHEERQVKDETVNVQITVKEKVDCTLFTLVDELNTELKSKYCRHVYNITHQHEQLKKLKENITDTESIVHIDFSENYGCKLNIEVQSMHFGASRNQASLHAGVLYLKDEKPTSFCSISDNTRHDPVGIWAHLHPVLTEIKQTKPSVDTIHFISDGPTTQYRSRNNFYLMKKKCIDKYGFTTVTWNFTEAGHGKGAPDGVGGLVKRTADKQVAYGNDITDASQLFTSLNEANLAVKLYFIQTDQISEIDAEMANVVTIPVKGTMLVHQVICRKESDSIYVRDLSCFCGMPYICDCLSLRKVMLLKQVGGNVRVDTAVGVSNATSVIAGSADTMTRDTESATLTSDDSVEFEYSVDLVGKWLVVEYDDLPYPGIVQDIDHESVVVKVMHRIGKNRFFWPAREDVCPYEYSQVVAKFDGMESVTSRHMQIPVHVWDRVSKQEQCNYNQEQCNYNRDWNVDLYL